jgi:hypothetical protein
MKCLPVGKQLQMSGPHSSGKKACAVLLTYKNIEHKENHQAQFQHLISMFTTLCGEIPLVLALLPRKGWETQ